MSCEYCTDGCCATDGCTECCFCHQPIIKSIEPTDEERAERAWDELPEPEQDKMCAAHWKAGYIAALKETK